MAVKRFHYNLILRPEPEGGFTVVVPALPGCITYGHTLEEAKKMAKDAIRAYIGSLKKHGEPVPTDTDSFISTVEIDAGSKSQRVYA